jgi:hypothetical protein
LNGGNDSAFRFPDVAQHGFVAQQGDAHDFWFGVVGNTHVDDTELSAKNIAATSVSETAILPNITCLLACLRPSVEPAVRFWRRKTRNAQCSTRTAKLAAPSQPKLITAKTEKQA